MGALRDFAEIIIENEPPAGASLVEKVVFHEMQPVGQKLAAARRAKGLTLLDVAKGVKIKIEHLVAIEAGDGDALPAVPFTAGFIKAYAQFIGLDPEEFATAYRREVGAPSPQPEAPASAPQWETPLSAPARQMPDLHLPVGPGQLASYFGIGAAAFCVIWFGISMLPREAPQAPRAAAEPVAAQTVVEQSPVTATEVVTAEPAAAFEEATPQSVTEQTPQIAVAAVEEILEEAPPVETRAKAPSRKPAKAEVVAAPAPVEEFVFNETLADMPSYEIAAASPEYVEPADVSVPLYETADDAPAILAQTAAPAPVLTTAPAVAPVQEANVVAAQIIRAAAPVYPERCIRYAAPTESIDVIFSITTAGRPVGIAVVDSSNECFNGAAINAASEMRFSPRRIDGRPAIETAKVVTVKFTR